MPLIATGVSHHTAPLEIRERLAISPESYPDKASMLCEIPGVIEAVVLSTCNRTEVYAMVSEGNQREIRNWLAKLGSLTSEQEQDLLYQHEGREAVSHLFSVACGLDSLVLGEPQILGQLKNAWQAATTAGAAGKITDRLFQKAFATAKQVRNGTGINDHPVSVAYITALLARQIFGDLSRKTVLLVGAGEMIALCARHFHQKQAQKMIIANRSLENAQQIAAEYSADALALEHLDERLAEADIVISCTAALDPIISGQSVTLALKARRSSPVFMVDLGVPRDIEPEVADYRSVYLYTIDDLRKVADESLDKRKEAAQQATSLIDQAVHEYLRWLHGARAAQGLRRLREHAEDSSEQLAQRAINQIEAGGDPETIVRQMSKTLTHKILHGPSSRLREAAELEHYDILKAADWLFKSDSIDDEDSEES